MSTTTTDELDLTELEELRKAHDQIREQMARQIVGQNEVVEQLLMAVFARGHCILEGVPGLAKTLMVHSLAQSLSLDFTRIQFTPDLMPSDITGTEVLYEDRQTGARELRFVHGPIFANLILADEINRTPPKTQAALLEAMQERQVTAGGRRHALARAVLRAGHAEPDRAGRNLSAARGPARPVPVQDLHHLSDARGRAADLPAHHGRRRARDHADAHRRANRGLAAGGAAGAGLGSLHRLRDGPGARDSRARRTAGRRISTSGSPGAPARAPANR